MLATIGKLAWIVPVIGVLLAPAVGIAQVTVSLPFEGRYHPGRFMPVRVNSPAGQTAIELGAPGAVGVILENPRAGESIVPFLGSSDSPGRVQVSGGKCVEIKPVGDHQRLVAFADADVNSAKPIYPSDEILPVALDLNRPLLEPVLAWTGLDAIVLGSGARSRVTDLQISVLLSAGVAIIVNEREIPDTRWPWRRLGNAWILRHQVGGPRDPIWAEAYTPTYSWDRGVPATSRRQVVLAAVIFTILALGVSLWRSTSATVGFVLLCIITAAIIWVSFLRRPPELLMQKAIAVRGADLTQVDQWAWRACLGNCRLVQPVAEFTMPVFASLHQIEASRIRLTCDSQGQPGAYKFSLAPNQSMAFVTRDVVKTIPLPRLSAVEPTWKDFANDVYVVPGDQVSGEGQISAELSATVVTHTGTALSPN